MLPEWLRNQMPFQSRFLADPDGPRMHFLDEGDGFPVVMLHGNPTWCFFYRNVVAALRERFRCIVPDHIGSGLSDKPQAYDYRLGTHIDNLEALVDSLGLERFHLIVHDWGGAIGMGLATRRPEWVERIVVLNTAAFRSKRIPLRINACRIPGLGALAVRGCNAFARGMVAFAREQPLPPEVRRGFLFPYNSWANRIGNLRFVEDIPLAESHPSYGTLRTIEEALPSLRDKPMRILWGMQDWCFTPEFLREWRERFPHAMVAEYGDAGHLLLEDAPEAIPEIGEFLGAAPDDPIVNRPPL